MPQTDPVKLRERQAQYREKNRDRIRTYAKQWRAENAEHVRAERKRWNVENPEKFAAYLKAKKARYQFKKYRSDDVEARKKRCINRAKQNARVKNREFTLTVESIAWPTVCPVLGIKLNYGAPKNGRDSWDSPSIDRRDSTRGYTPDNVAVMSWRANRIKADSTLDELEKLVIYMRKTRTN